MVSTNLNIHFSPSTRQDYWGKLRTATIGLEKSRQDGNFSKQYIQEIHEILELLSPLESLWAFPGHDRFSSLTRLFNDEFYRSFHRDVFEISELVESRDYRRTAIEAARGKCGTNVHYFEVLVVGQISGEQEEYLRHKLHQWRSDQDKFVYEVIVVSSLSQALVAVLLNYDIQSVIVHDDFAIDSDHDLLKLAGLPKLTDSKIKINPDEKQSIVLGKMIHDIRPELDLFLSTRASPTDFAGSAKIFTRLFHLHENSGELHLSIIKSVGRRYRTPFFDALKKYSREPVGAFHALPISRGNSVFRSPWLKDFHEFYGSDIFLAESSATTGGLDSLLQPTGTLQQAQWKANICFGSQQTYFVTAGTSTTNKIVHQAITKEGDIILMDRSAHESHHMALLVTGASPYYLSSYNLDKYSIAGGVPLITIKKALLDLKEQGLIDRVKMITLTNCTFDGLTYNVERYMQEILAIKPDLVFLWDEAWFAFARFVPNYRQRTAMYVAAHLTERFSSDEYREEYRKYQKEFLSKHPEPDEAWLEQTLLPDPDNVRLRVYASQSTHKTLSSFRQGSMIHIWDEDFNTNSDQFNKAYLTHTTTSPNYQILASLDVSRRQVHLEGYELVQRSIEMALIIRNSINSHATLNRYFQALGPEELIPDRYRISGVKGIDPKEDAAAIAKAWLTDDFVLDPCRITVYIGKTGVNGFVFRTRYLAERCNIQVNKTGLNSVCFMTNIGTTQSAVSYLIESLIRMANEFENNDTNFSEEQQYKFESKREKMTQLPTLPEFTGFHPAFLLDQNGAPGQIRKAYFAGYDAGSVHHYQIDELDELLDRGETPVAATFIIPVPPGFPLLVPGQFLDKATVLFLKALNTNEIIGLEPELGIRFFKPEYLKDKFEKPQIKAKPESSKPAKLSNNTKVPDVVAATDT